MKVISKQSDVWSKSGLNSISQNHKVNMVIEDTNMIICVGQGAGQTKSNCYAYHKYTQSCHKANILVDSKVIA